MTLSALTRKVATDPLTEMAAKLAAMVPAGFPLSPGEVLPVLVGAIKALVAAALLLVSPGLAGADARFELDPTQNLANLAHGGIALTLDRVQGTYLLDASAVLPARPEMLLRVALDYERYTRMGIPNLRESHVLTVAAEPDVVYAWTWMSGLGRSSKQYLRVRIRRDLGHPGAVALAWTLAPRQPSWPYEEAPAFVRLDGSWYLQPVGEGASYVRYRLAAVPDPGIPDAVVGWLIKRQLRDAARGVIEALAREAAAGR
jgi:hypothetical protein